MTANRDVALVTGAAGFIGREVVHALSRRGATVRAAVRKVANAQLFETTPNVDCVVTDLRNVRSLRTALDGASSVYHFAAVMRGKGNTQEINDVNVAGTESLWDCAADSGVERALFCSTVSVYGLLAGSAQPISESIVPKAVEPYGRAKLLAERVALDVGRNRNVATTVIRPAAVLGPGERSLFGRAIRRAALTRLLIPGAYSHNRFSYVHVSDVAEAAVHVMSLSAADGELYNVAVDRPISFDQAFEVYKKVLNKAGSAFWRPKLLAAVSALLQRHPRALSRLMWGGNNSPVFPVWRLDRELVFTSKKLLDTGFRFSWPDFEDVLESCLAN